jgi:DNA-directed RNA polymerase specialized sigma24 family protein
VATNREWSDDTGSLRRFGLALTRDERFVVDDASATRLVDKLVRQTCVAAIGDERVSYVGRSRAFARFIQLYRRYVRRMALEDMDGNWVETPPTGRGGPSVANGVRALPLELREALLLVALAGFSHREAAEALDIPLTRFYERLDRARERLTLHLGADVGSEREAAWRGAPYLRVIK